MKTRSLVFILNQDRNSQMSIVSVAGSICRKMRRGGGGGWGEGRRGGEIFVKISNRALST